MSQQRTPEAVKAFWNGQAAAHGEDVLATMPDRLLKELEIKALLRHLPGEGRVLDIGCGNGYSTLRFASERSIEITGVDYSEEMISAAHRAASNAAPSVQQRVRFETGDVLSTRFSSSEFDVVMTDRCLINLITLEDQQQALREIHRLLKPRGLYLMCEDTQEGLAALNELRIQVDLQQIPTRWHNLYLSEADLQNTWESLFELQTVDSFSSLYYVASRIFNAKLAAMNGEEPSYDHPINHIAAELPSIGDRGPLKLFVFRKRG